MTLAMAPPLIVDPPRLTAEERLRLYTPAEVVALGLLPWSERTLLDMAYAKKIPHTKPGGKIRFRLDHIAAIQQAGDVNPATRGRRRAA
ncbi:helix-turn-helix domain-containing protein [Kitasatospora sp. NPDC092948]|uniref:helix-turn-helix domain-containing protein n=1 Tax=Kitasatospora sp. NPDC092948 TaxID=3364088 RepID=UPI003829CA68